MPYEDLKRKTYSRVTAIRSLSEKILMYLFVVAMNIIHHFFRENNELSYLEIKQQAIAVQYHFYPTERKTQ